MEASDKERFFSPYSSLMPKCTLSPTRRSQLIKAIKSEMFHDNQKSFWDLLNEDCEEKGETTSLVLTVFPLKS